jgi:hypothetical protein
MLPQHLAWTRQLPQHWLELELLLLHPGPWLP